MRSNKFKIINSIFVIFFIIFILFSVYFIKNDWDQFVINKNNEAISIANNIAIGLDGEMIKILRAVPEDEETMPFQSIKNRLERFLKINENIRFIYLYIERNGKLYFLADSESSTSPDYSPPGQEYEEADEIYKKAIYSKKPIITSPVSDRWGRWISVLVPITNRQSGDNLSVLGVDYPADKWYEEANQNLKNNIFIVLIIIALFSLVFIFLRRLIIDKDKFESLVENIPGIIYSCQLDKNWTMNYLSGSIQKITGYYPSEILNNKEKSFASIIFAEDRELVEKTINKAVADRKSYDIEYRLTKKNNKIIWVQEKGRAVYNKGGEALYLDGFIFDISDKKEILFKMRTKQLETEKLNRFMIGRELKMAELKKEIDELKKKLN